MFGLQLQNDEWLLVTGVACLILRVLHALLRVLWCFLTDSQIFSLEMGRVQTALIVIMPLFTMIGWVIISIALVSIYSNGPAQNFRDGTYGTAGIVGLIIGVIFETLFTIRMMKLSFWLAGFRLPRYRELLQSGNPDERFFAAQRLQCIGAYARPARNELLIALHDESADVRAACARAILYSNSLSTNDDDRDTPAAARVGLNDSDFRVRAAAAAILVQFHAATPEEVLPVFIEALKHGDKDTVVATVMGLDSLGADAEPACETLKEEILKRAEELYSAFTILQRIGAPAVPALISILDEGDYNLKFNAIDSLRKIGPPARDALPALNKIARDSFHLRFPAKRAIRKIGRADN